MPEQAAVAEEMTVAMSVRPLLAALSCLAAAWIVSGSTGVLVHPLRRVLTLLGLGVAVVVFCPLLKRSWLRLLGLVVVVCLSAWAVTSTLPLVNVAGVAILLIFLALAYTGPDRQMLRVCAVSVVLFGLYRTCLVSIPWLWLSADLAGRAMGRVAGLITQRPLWIGATFAGLDFLVLTSTLAILWLVLSPPPRRRRALYGALVILCGHLCYLIVLSYATDLLALVPKPALQPHVHQGMQPFLQQWSWQGLVHKAVPWNLPALACAIHLLIVAAMFRWAAWTPVPKQDRSWSSRPIARLAALAAACLLPVVTGLYPGKLSLENKKIVFYDKTYVTWQKPTHGSYGRLSGGMCGMVPAYMESLGARTLVSPDLSAEDLNGADVLVVYCPAQPWADGQLERIWQFVREGGSLLLMSEHTIRDSGRSNRSNDLLKPTAVRVPFDSATFAVMGWDQSYDALVHPATAGVSDKYNQFGVSIGASLHARWPASPLLAGRWGWTDFGDDGNSAGKLGNWSYDPAEKLGDILMAAEQRLGRGRVMAFGDTSNLMNTTLLTTYGFMGRVLAYLSSDVGQAHGWWRQVLGMAIACLLVALVAWRVDVWAAAFVVLGLAGALVACTTLNQQTGTFIPDGGEQKPNNVAYVDASHVEAYCDFYWRPDDAAALALTLMRNGYLPFSLSELTAERLERAGLLISIAPSRAFTSSECAVVRDFVARGGTFLITVGYDESPASRSILSEFGFAIGSDSPNGREPDPMGRFKSPYLRSGDRFAHVRFHAAWPVLCSDPNARVIANGRENLPVIVMRRIGAGRVVVIGDTGFALNKNLENEEGQPIEGLRENADFWRWFLAQLRGEPMWAPPALRAPEPSGANPRVVGQPADSEEGRP